MVNLSKRISSQKGFTLNELMVVVIIIVALSTMSIIILNSTKVKARDAKRIEHVKQLTTALELYYINNGSYPLNITPGQALKSPDNKITYIAEVPSNPNPRDDGDCAASDYIYKTQKNNTTYTIDFCLGSDVATLRAGINQATRTGIQSFSSGTVPVTAGIKVDRQGKKDWTSELGGDDPNGETSFTIVLESQPASDVRIDISSSDTSEAVVNLNQIFFTSSNWNSPQMVQVIGVDDTEIEDNQTNYYINFAVTSSDPNYNNKSVSPLPFINYDDCGGTGGVEKGQCSFKNPLYTCQAQTFCPGTFFCSGVQVVPEICESGQSCFRNGECASKTCADAQYSDPPIPGFCK